MLSANPKSNPYFRLSSHKKEFESSIQLFQWYDAEKKKSKAKRIAIWCTNYNVFYSLRNLLVSIAWHYQEIEPETVSTEKNAYEIGFWDNEKTANEGMGPFVILKIYQPNFGNNCTSGDDTYIIWITLDEEYISL